MTDALIDRARAALSAAGVDWAVLSEEGGLIRVTGYAPSVEAGEIARGAIASLGEMEKFAVAIADPTIDQPAAARSAGAAAAGPVTTDATLRAAAGSGPASGPTFGGAAAASAPPASPPPAPAKQMNTAGIVVLGVAVLALIGGGAWWLANSDDASLTSVAGAVSATTGAAGQNPVGQNPAAGGANGAAPVAAATCRTSLTLPKQTYRVNEELRFTVSADDNCNFFVFTVGADDSVQVHDPRRAAEFMGAPVLRAGEVRPIPIDGAPGRAFIQGPPGAYRIGVISSKDELEALGVNVDALRQAAEGGFRNFQFRFDEQMQGIDQDRLERVTVEYQVTG